MDQITQPFISVDIEPNSVAGVCEKLSQTFNELGVSAERSSGELHVSLAYVLGTCEKSVLSKIAKKIAEQKLQARVTGIEVLEGKTTGYDYVALSFENGNTFAQASEQISEEVETKQFENGFRSHLTLFRFRKGERKNLERVCKRLSLEDAPVICGKSVSVFNSSYEKQLTLAI